MVSSTPNTAQALFTFGFERSGTTLLSMLLGAHPDLAVPFSTTGLWYRYWRNRRAYAFLRDRPAVERLVDDLLAEERIRLWDVDFTANDITADLPLEDFSSVVARFHCLYADKTGKARWALHDIATLYDMDVAYQWFPDARFLHIVRDPRDVALSHLSYQYGANNEFEVTRNWREAVHTNTKMGRILGDRQYKVIRYEDLVGEPEATLKDICTFAGIAFSQKMLDHQSDVESKVPAAKMFLWPNLKDAPNKAPVGRWRRMQKPHITTAIEEAAGDLMERLGYERAGGRRRFIRTESYLLKSLLVRGGRLKRLRSKLPFGKKQTSTN